MIACVMMVFMMDLVINVHIGGGVLLVCTSGFGFVCWYVLHFTLVHNYINKFICSSTESACGSKNKVRCLRRCGQSSYCDSVTVYPTRCGSSKHANARQVG